MTATNGSPDGTQYLIRVVLLVVIILVAGIITTAIVASQQDAAMRDVLLTKARIASKAIEPHNISTLQGTSTDLSSSGYGALKEHLKEVRAADPDIRFIYLIGRHTDGNYFFFADSEPPQSQDYSPPGEVFTDMTGPMVSVFSNGTSQSEGPSSDKWGTWMSAYVPVSDPATGNVIALYGMDVDARLWNLQIFRAALLPGAATIVLILMVLVFFSLNRQTEKERRRLEASEKALAESENNFRSFFETTREIIAAASPEGKILFVSKAFEQALGYQAGNPAPLEIRTILPMEARGNWEEIVASAAGNTGESSLTLVAKSGIAVPVRIRAWPGSWNGTACFFFAAKDLTAEQEAEERFERLFRHNPSIMAVSSMPDRRFTDVNDAFLARLGYSREDLLGKTSADLGMFENVPEQQVAMMKLIDQGHFSNIELQVRRKDGVILDGNFSGEIISLHGRQYLLTVMIDITEQKALEHEIRFHEGELLKYSEELAKDIEERKRIEKALMEANKKLNLLSSITRHDILNQITSLGLILHILTETITDDYSRGMIRTAQGTTDRITHQIEFTKEYEDIGVKKPQWQNVTDLIHGAQDMLTKCPFDVVAETGSLEVYADPLLNKVFYNLLENSVRHGENVTRARFSVVKSGDSVKLIYEDDGIGIDPESKKNLFRRGFGKHTGFGLYMMREILAITGITIAETGEPGRGARFEITLPEEDYRFSNSSG